AVTPTTYHGSWKGGNLWAFEPVLYDANGGLDPNRNLCYAPMFGVLFATSTDTAGADYANRAYEPFQVTPKYNVNCDYRRASSPPSGLIHVALCDGSTRSVAAGINPVTWYAALTPSAGDAIGSDW